jgi:xanthine/CO dehydrogenase XdhC/CoxF family maturation factor
VGLEIGSYQPAVIALAIVAEMQAVLAGKEVTIMDVNHRPRSL